MSEEKTYTYRTESRQAASKSSAITPPPAMAGKYLPEIGIEISTLPSKSICYPENSKVKYRPFSFGEVKKLSESKNMTLRDRFNVVLDGIETRGFQKLDLTLFDFLFLGLLRKISTLGSRGLTAQYFCGKCQQKGSHQFNLDEIEFSDLKAPALPIVVDLWGEVNVHFAPPTVRDFLKLIEKGKHRDDIAMIATSVKNIKFDEAYKLVYHSTADDVQFLKEIDEYLNHDVKPIVFKCENLIDSELKTVCGNEIIIEVAEEDTLIMPFRRNEQHSASRLRFGLQT